MPVQHLALIRFKADITPQTIDATFAGLRQLTRDIPGITGFTGGTNTSPEGLDQGYTHGFVMTFQNTAARDAYLPHPAHEKFKQSAGPLIEKIVVFDYES